MKRSSLARTLCLLGIAAGAFPMPAHADGNVTATVRNGQLILRGDNADNQLRITTDGAPAGGVTLIPRIDTTINGVLVDFLDVPDIPRGVRAGFGGGEDSFGGSELETFPGDMIVDMGGENDTVAFTDLNAERCSFSFGAGHDNVGFDTLSCAEVTIRGGGGDDQMQWSGGGVSGATSIGMSGGADVVTLENVAFGGPVRVTMGGGNDLLSLAFDAFEGTAYFSGGSGSANAFVDDGTSTFNVPPTIVRFQQ